MKFLYIFLSILLSNCVSLSKTSTLNTNILATVVLDPGHGGHDSGAVSKSGLKEKDITLDVAKRLKRIINQNLPSVRVVLTRNEDKYVKLEDRIQIAQKAKGDVFISLHVNSSTNKKASGLEIYSLDVASDRHAERLAKRENDSFKEKRGVKFILADLRASSNRKMSDELALNIGSSFKLSNNRGVNQALFQVLFVKMPAVLAELLFISNPKEEKLLRNQKFRERLSFGMYLGIKKYLIKNGKKYVSK